MMQVIAAKLCAELVAAGQEYEVACMQVSIKSDALDESHSQLQ
jgi:hypothetical protein